MFSDSSFVGQYIINGSFLQGLIVEILGGILFLWVILFLLRPKFRISDKIIKYDADFPVINPTGRKIKYSVKVINDSCYPAIDVEASFGFYRLIPSANSIPHKDYTEIKLNVSEISYIPNCRNKKNEYAVWFSTFEDLDMILGNFPANSVTFHFKISMKHGLTGLTKAKEMEYSKFESCKQFKPGNTFDVEY